MNQLSSSETSLRDRLQRSFTTIDGILDTLVLNGFISSGERSMVSADQIEDWIDGIASCTFTIAIDGDTTLQGKKRVKKRSVIFP